MSMCSPKVELAILRSYTSETEPFVMLSRASCSTWSPRVLRTGLFGESILTVPPLARICSMRLTSGSIWMGAIQPGSVAKSMTFPGAVPKSDQEFSTPPTTRVSRARLPWTKKTVNPVKQQPAILR